MNQSKDVLTDVLIVGKITDVEYLTTVRGDKMAFILVENLLRTVEAVVFPVAFAKSGDAIRPGEIVAIKGREEKRSDGTVKIYALEISKQSDPEETEL